MVPSLATKKTLVDIGKRLNDRGLIAGSDGNISVRLDGDRVLITPSGLAKGHLTDEDIVTVDMDGRKLEGWQEASSELSMHLFIYRQRPDVRACVHAHPPFATAFAVAGAELPSNILPEVVVFVGEIPLTAYAPPGTPAVPEALAPFIEADNAFLLRNHGLLTLGRTLEQACNRHETVEHLAQIIHLASQLGTPNPLPQEDIERLLSIRAGLEKYPNKRA